MQSPLAHPGWVSFNEKKWGLACRSFTFGDELSTGALAQLIGYRNVKGRLRMPLRCPYLPIFFRSTNSQSGPRIERQWLELSGELAKAMHEQGWGGAISFDPSVTDVRSWQWLGYRAEVRYTYFIDFPFSLSLSTSAVRKQINKARRTSYFSERTTNWEDVVKCLVDTERRQGFSNQLCAADMELLHGLTCDTYLRAYICRTSSGEAASARIVLHVPGTRAIDWVAGTVSEHLRTGATQLLIDFVLRDLTEAGASGFDYAGADIARVAAAKAEWGGRLVPFYTIRPNNFHTIALDIKRWMVPAWHKLRRRA